MRKYHTHITLIILACILYVMANFQRVAIPGAIFDILQADLGAKAPTITSFGATFMYSYAFSLLAIGILVDRFSGVKVILWGGFSAAVGTFRWTGPGLWMRSGRLKKWCAPWNKAKAW